LVGYFDVPPDKWTTIEFTDRLVENGAVNGGKDNLKSKVYIGFFNFRQGAFDIVMKSVKKPGCRIQKMLSEWIPEIGVSGTFDQYCAPELAMFPIIIDHVGDQIINQ